MNGRKYKMTPSLIKEGSRNLEPSQIQHTKAESRAEKQSRSLSQWDSWDQPPVKQIQTNSRPDWKHEGRIKTQIPQIRHKRHKDKS